MWVVQFDIGKYLDCIIEGYSKVLPLLTFAMLIRADGRSDKLLRIVESVDRRTPLIVHDIETFIGRRFAQHGFERTLSVIINLAR